MRNLLEGVMDNIKNATENSEAPSEVLSKGPIEAPTECSMGGVQWVVSIDP